MKNSRSLFIKNRFCFSKFRRATILFKCLWWNCIWTKADGNKWKWSQKRVGDTLKLLIIDELRNRQPYHLSGGEKKKVSIASVVVLNLDVYIFDEPMNGLDPKTKRFLKEFMITINNAGKTILCSTHDFEYVNGVFKRAVVFLSDHIIIRYGSYDKIMNYSKCLYDNNIK